METIKTHFANKNYLVKMETVKKEMNNFLSILEKTFIDSGFIKLIGAFIITLLMNLNLFFIPIIGFMKLIAVLVTADFITGVIASLMKGNKFTSSGIKRTVFKITGYSIALIVAHHISLVLIPDLQAAYFATFYIVSTELKSLDENMEKIFGVSVLGFISERLGFNNKNKK